ncbi:histidine kinase [Cecembia calidifontis]|jgi:sensor histidine kinase YesM|uniref:Histidine kinase n=2 Tax=Cecembia calidifontis TaxID=1187080 RepID=A0A4Q7PEU5_9BACT|nr:histidine kinase [Cecembia calidifontis]
MDKGLSNIALNNPPWEKTWQKMRDFLTKKTVYHPFFWMVYFVFFYFAYNNLYEDKTFLSVLIIIYGISHFGMYYIFQYSPLKDWMKTKKFWLVPLVFIFLAIVFGYLIYLLMSLIFDRDLNQEFQSSTFSIIVYMVTSNIFTPVIFLGLKAQKENRKSRILEDKREKERIKNELHYLKSQVNPHFLFNTINSIYVLIKIDPEKASETLIKLSNLLRSQLYEFSVERIDIQKELEYLENYIELEKIRKGNRLDFKLEKEGELQGFQIAPLVLIPFLENCFKHLSTHLDRPNIIRVKIKRQGNTLEAEFFNTSESIAQNQQNTMGGLGLANIKRRLELVYPDQYELNIRKGEGDFNVNLKINF